MSGGPGAAATELVTPLLVTDPACVGALVRLLEKEEGGKFATKALRMMSKVRTRGHVHVYMYICVCVCVCVLYM